MLDFALKSALTLVLLYLPLAALMRRDTHFAFARRMMVAALLLSLTLPLVNIPQLATWSEEAMATIAVSLSAEPPTVQPVLLVAPADKRLDWGDVLAVLYVAGVVLVIACRTMQMLRLWLFMRRGCLWTDTIDGVTIYCHAVATQPFSWMRSIVVSAADIEGEGGDTILRHEMAHVRLHHSADMLLLTAVQALQWFNPVAWMMTRTMQEIHEFEADEAVLCAGVARRQYQLLLIRKAAANDWPAFANCLRNHSLKKRFQMMTTKKSHPWSRAKALAMLPMALVALAAFASNPKPATTASFDFSGVDAFFAQLQDDKIYDKAEVDPGYAKGEMEYFKFVNDNLRYPQAAIEAKLQGQVVLAFVVEKDGSLSNFTVLRSPHVKDKSIPEDKRKAAEQALKDESIRVLKLTSKWKPGMIDNKPVRCRFSLPIVFRL